MFTFFYAYFFAQQHLSPEEHSRVNTILSIEEGEERTSHDSEPLKVNI
jgi:hypothetical protein